MFEGGVERRVEKKFKGCDIGYALAASSCERVSGVDACTVTACDVITAFAVSVPSLLLAEPAGFFGPECPADRSTGPITQSTSDQMLFISTDPFDRRRTQSYNKIMGCQYPG